MTLLFTALSIIFSLGGCRWCKSRCALRRNPGTKTCTSAQPTVVRGPMDSGKMLLPRLNWNLCVNLQYFCNIFWWMYSLHYDICAIQLWDNRLDSFSVSRGTGTHLKRSSRRKSTNSKNTVLNEYNIEQRDVDNNKTSCMDHETRA